MSDKSSSPTENEPLVPQNDKINVQIQDEPNIEDTKEIATASIFNSVLNATNTVVGYSIVTLPYVFYLNGIVLGSILFIFFGCLNYYVLSLLTHATAVSKQYSFKGIATYSFGNKSGIVLEFILMIQMFGISVIYSMIIAQVLVPFFQRVFSNTSIINNYTVMAIIMLFILFPVSSLKKLEFIGYGSGIAMLCACYFGSAVFIRFVQKLFFTYRGISFQSINWGSPTIGNVIRSISFVGFSYGCQSSVPQIYKELKDRTESKMNLALLITILNCFSIFMIVGISGYMQFAQVNPFKESILENFDDDDLVLTIAKFCVGVIVTFSFPIVLFVCRNSIEIIFFSKYKESTIRRLAITGILCFVIYLLSIFISSLSIVIGLINTTAGAIINYIYPFCAYIILEKRWSRRIPALIFGLLALFVSLVCFGLVIVDIIVAITGITPPL
eukprot:gene5344-9153_t